eukprot:363172-Chlamydomonas_euryale.AAC.1
MEAVCRILHPRRRISPPLRHVAPATGAPRRRRSGLAAAAIWAEPPRGMEQRGGGHRTGEAGCQNPWKPTACPITQRNGTSWRSGAGCRWTSHPASTPTSLGRRGAAPRLHLAACRG